MDFRQVICGLAALAFVRADLSAFAAETLVVDAARAQLALEAVAEKLADKRVVFIGETHDRFDHHLSQLEVIRSLHERMPRRWVIGVEYFQRPFQPHLDAYIAGSISEHELLSKTEYFDRWGYDYRLYRPIFQYAREQGIQLVALNAERELTRRIGEVGLAGLSTEERARLPEQIDRSDIPYRDRLRPVFEEHADSSKDFERFLAVQLVWDETMAEQTARYLMAHADRGMIVLAGAEHIAFGSGIPNRVKRRLPSAQTAMLQPADTADADMKGADYLLVSMNQSLPPVGRMGIVMDFSDGVTVREITVGGAAAQAGIRPKDNIIGIDQTPVQSVTDVRLALLEKPPGERVTLRVRREGGQGVADLSFELVLQK